MWGDLPLTLAILGGRARGACLRSKRPDTGTLILTTGFWGYTKGSYTQRILDDTINTNLTPEPVEGVLRGYVRV